MLVMMTPAALKLLGSLTMRSSSTIVSGCSVLSTTDSHGRRQLSETVPRSIDVTRRAGKADRKRARTAAPQGGRAAPTAGKAARGVKLYTRPAKVVPVSATSRHERELVDKLATALLTKGVSRADAAPAKTLAVEPAAVLLSDIWGQDAAADAAAPCNRKPVELQVKRLPARTAVATGGYSMNPSLESHQADLAAAVAKEHALAAAAAALARRIRPDAGYAAANLDSDDEEEGEAAGGKTGGSSSADADFNAALAAAGAPASSLLAARTSSKRGKRLAAREAVAASAAELLATAVPLGKGVPYAAVVPLTLPLSHELTGSLRTMKRVGATGVASEHLAPLVSNSGVAAKALTAAQKKFKTKHPYREVVFPRSAWAGSEKYEVLARRDKR